VGLERARRVSEGDTVVGERGGVPQAVVMGLSQYQRRSTGSQVDAWRRLAQAASGRLAGAHQDALSPDVLGVQRPRQRLVPGAADDDAAVIEHHQLLVPHGEPQHRGAALDGA